MSDCVRQVHPVHITGHDYIGNNQVKPFTKLPNDCQCLGCVFGVQALKLPYLQDHSQEPACGLVIIHNDAGFLRHRCAPKVFLERTMFPWQGQAVWRRLGAKSTLLASGIRDAHSLRNLDWSGCVYKRPMR